MYSEDEARLIKENEELTNRLKAMYEIVKKREWGGHAFGYGKHNANWCTECWNHKDDGHSPNCSDAAELRLTEQLLGINQTEVKV